MGTLQDELKAWEHRQLQPYIDLTRPEYDAAMDRGMFGDPNHMPELIGILTTNEEDNDE